MYPVMYPVRNYVTTKEGRRPIVYSRCRRASHNGTCVMRQVTAAVLEPAGLGEPRALLLDPGEGRRRRV